MWHNLYMQTKQQIMKAMEVAGITGEVSGTRKDWEVELADEKTMRAFCRKVAKLGGYRTGYGAWILRPNYQDLGEWSSVAARWHY